MVATRIASLLDQAVQVRIGPLVDSTVDSRARELTKSLEAIGDSVRDKKREVQKDQDELVEKVAKVRTSVDAQIDALEEGIKKKANSFLIPAMTIVLLAAFLAPWTAVGALVSQFARTPRSPSRTYVRFETTLLNDSL